MAVGRAAALLLAVALAACGSPASSTLSTHSPGQQGGSLGRDPVQQPASAPPASAPTNPAWIKCGVYAMPVANDMAVRMIEHGVVWIAYRPDLPEDQVQQLRDLVSGKKYVLLSPAPPDAPLSDPVVATAQELQSKVDSASDPALAQFIDQYAKGPQPAGPGVPCVDE